MKSFACALASLAVFHCVATAAEPETYDLRYKFQVGQVLRYQEAVKNDYELQVDTTIDKPHSYQTSTKSLIIRKVDAQGNAVVRTRFDSVEELETFSEGQVYKYNPVPDKDEPVVFASLREAIGVERMELTIAPTGTVSNPVPVAAAILKAQAAVVAKNPNERVMEVFPLLPSQPVKINESWTDSYTVQVIAAGGTKLPRPINVQKRYTLAKVEGNIATINYVTTVLTPLNDPQEEAQLLQSKPRGAFQLDIPQGQMLQHVVAQEGEVVGANGPNSITKFKQSRSETILRGQAAIIPVRK